MLKGVRKLDKREAINAQEELEGHWNFLDDLQGIQVVKAQQPKIFQRD
jgi:hypothetical protein